MCALFPRRRQSIIGPLSCVDGDCAYREKTRYSRAHARVMGHVQANLKVAHKALGMRTPPILGKARALPCTLCTGRGGSGTLRIVGPWERLAACIDERSRAHLTCGRPSRASCSWGWPGLKNPSGSDLRGRHRPTAVGGKREARTAEPTNQRRYKYRDVTSLCTGTDDRSWGMWM